MSIRYRDQAIVWRHAEQLASFIAKICLSDARCVTTLSLFARKLTGCPQGEGGVLISMAIGSVSHAVWKLQERAEDVSAGGKSLWTVPSMRKAEPISPVFAILRSDGAQETDEVTATN